MTHVLGVSTSGFYARRRRPKSLHAMEDEVLADMIATIHAESRGTYGAPRIQAELALAQGIGCSRRRIARLMRQQGLRGVSRRRLHRPTTTVRDEGAAPARDLVRRDFHASRPNVLWVADITYVPTLEGFLYLACVLDVCTRRCVGWAMRDTLATEIVTAALDMAIQRARPAAGLIHHSDHGSQYTSTVFGRRCQEAGIVPSMGTVGDCFDNAMAESLFATLESELIDREIFRTREEARTKVFDYLETWYNPRRRHSARREGQRPSRASSRARASLSGRTRRTSPATSDRSSPRSPRPTSASTAPNLMKEQLRQVFHLPADQALALLEGWLAWARRSRIPAFVALARSVAGQRAGIAAALTNRLSNALVESVWTCPGLLTHVEIRRSLLRG